MKKLIIVFFTLLLRNIKTIKIIIKEILVMFLEIKIM